MGAGGKSSLYLFSVECGRGVENGKPRAQQDCLSRHVTATMYYAPEIYIRKKRVDMVRGPKVGKCLGYVAGRDDVMAPVPNHRLGHFPNENIVFYDQNHCHF